jgi:Sulfotransferase family
VSDGERVRVLFVMGHGSSGTTILGNTLGEVDGLFHAGELRTIWGEALAGLQTCGCGRPIRECPVWSRILADGFPGLDDAGAARLARLHADTIRVRYTFRLLREKPGAPSHWAALREYAEVAGRLYRAIAAATGARVIVDTSKRTGDAALLRLLPGVDPLVLHVVRDPRAVAYSWSHRSGSPPGELATAGEWLAFSTLGEAVKWRLGAGRSMVLRHEDFAERPRASIERVLRFVGAAGTPIPLSGPEDRTVEFGENHTVAGHWTRFNRGSTDLRLSTEWRSKQGRGQRLLVTGVTLPLLPRYGYPLLPGR